MRHKTSKLNMAVAIVFMLTIELPYTSALLFLFFALITIQQLASLIEKIFECFEGVKRYLPSYYFLFRRGR